jgi:hypothetical protein
MCTLLVERPPVEKKGAIPAKLVDWDERPELFCILKMILRVLNSLIERETSWLWMSLEMSRSNNLILLLMK